MKVAPTLHSVEPSFDLDAEGVPQGIRLESGDVAHELIEECMLLANRAIGHWLAEQVPVRSGVRTPNQIPSGWLILLNF